MDSSEFSPVVLVCSLASGSVDVPFVQGRLSKMTVPELKSLARQFKLVVSSIGKKKDDIIERLLDMGKSGKLERSTLADCEESASFCLDETEPELSLSLQDWLVRGAANSNDIRDHLRSALQKVTIDHLR